MTARRRCSWAPLEDPEYLAYHDEEWGVPVHDDARLFEMLTLEGAQAGLSWATILHKREGYRRAFAGFDAAKVARFTRREGRTAVAGSVDRPQPAEGRSRPSRTRARRSRAEGVGSLDAYLWGLAGGSPTVNRWRTLGDLPAKRTVSRAMSKDLKRRGFRFVGPTVCYAFMQAIGMVNDHVIDCYRWKELR